MRLGIKKKAEKINKDDISLEVSIPSKIIIITKEKYLNSALLVQKQLSDVNIQSGIINEEPITEFSDSLYIVIEPSQFSKLPTRYVTFQIEKIEPSVVEGNNLLKIFNKAESILEHSIENIDFLQKNGISFRKIFYLPIDQKGSFGQFSYYFKRFLLSKGFIDYKNFTESVGNIELSNFVCLGLPETIERAISFKKENENRGIQVFYGLRFNIGWIGCGLSYKYILHLAKQQQLDYIIVCEDDVEFFEGFDSKLEIILEYLKANMEKWDVYSGFIADVHREMDVMDIEEFKGIEFVYIDKLMSMVFNIYNKSFFDKLNDWEPNNLDKENNTIDRYIERMDSLRIVTNVPYIVGHKEDLNSSVWKDIQNTIYTCQINKSEDMLKNKIGYYKMTKKLKSFF